VHMFNEVDDFLPGGLLAELAALEPSKSATAAVKESCHYRQRFLLKNYDLPAPVKAFCLIHQCPCPTSYTHPAEEPERPLIVNLSGPPCLPWTTIGTRLGYGHPSIAIYNKWLRYVREERNDLLFVENSHLFPFSDFEEGMGPEYQCLHICVCLAELGVPMRRPRLYGVALLRRSLIWVGPPQDELKDAFLSLFGKQCLMESDDFVGLDSEVPYLFQDGWVLFPRRVGGMGGLPRTSPFSHCVLPCVLPAVALTL
jgi:hypothetical protein